MSKRATACAGLLSVMALSSTACMPFGTEIRGDVFIATNSGAAIRLALVTVQAIPEDACRAALRGRVDAWRRGPGLQVARDRARADSLFSAASAAYSATRSLEARESERLRVLSAQAAVRSAYDESPTDPPLDYLAAGLPQGVAVARTDADGRFQLHIPAGKTLMICAVADRQAGGVHEHLVWICRAPHDNSYDFHLSNDNLLTDEAAAQLLRQ